MKTLWYSLAAIPQGDYTEWERTRDLVLRHFLNVSPSIGLGLAYGYSRQSEQKFLSFPIEYAVKKTIEEHYETPTIRETVS